ncbi:hypothetical protein D3C72_1872610 [compost metagenome]
MITNLKLQPLFVIDNQCCFSVNFGHVQAFRALLGDINKTRLELFDQFGPKIAEHEQGVHIQITDCQ